MTNVGAAKFRLEADDARLVATLSQLPGKVAAILGQIETRSKSQSSSAGAAAGNAFAQALTISAKASIAGVGQATATISTNTRASMGQAGTSAGQAFSQNLGNAVRSGSSAVVSSVTSTGQAAATAMGQAGSNAGNAFSRSLQSSIQSGSTNAVSAIVKPFANVGTSIGNSIKSQIGNIGRGMGERIGQNITDGILGVSNRISGAIFDTKNIVNYDAAVRQIRTLKGDTNGFVAAAKNITRELGNNANQVDALNSLYDVMSSGVSKASDAQKVLSASIKLATTGNADLGEVQKTTLGIMNAYGIGADGAAKITDQLFGAVNAGVITSRQLSSTLGNVTSTAAAAGVDLAEVLTLVSVATLKAVQPEAAVTGARAIIDSFTGLTKEGEKAAKALGVNFDAAALKAKGPIAIIKELEAKGATAQQFADIFSSVEARKVVNTIRGKEGTTMVSSVRETIGKTKVSDSYGDVASGIGERQKQLENRLKDLDVNFKSGAFGAAIANAFSTAGQAIDAFVSQIEKLNDWYAKLGPQSKSFVNTIGGIGIAATAAGFGLISFGIAATLLSTPMAIASKAAIGLITSLFQIAIATAPVTIPLLAAGGAVYFISKALGSTDGDAFKNAMIAVGTGLAIVFGPSAIAAVVTGAIAIGSSFGGMAIAASAALIPLLPWIAAAAGVAAALYGLYKVFEAAKPTLSAWAKSIGDAAKGAWDGLVRFASDTAATLGKWASDFGNWIKPALDWFGRLATGIGDLLGALGNLLIRSFAAMLTPVIDWVSKAAQWLGSFASSALQIVSNWGSAILQAVGATFSAMAQAVTTTLQIIGNSIGNFTKAALSAITSFVSSVISAMGRWLASLPGVSQALALLGRGIEALKTMAVTSFKAVVEGAVYLKNGVVGAFDAIVKSVKDAINWLIKLPETLSNAAKAITNFNNTPAPQAPPSAPSDNYSDPQNPGAALPKTSPTQSVAKVETQTVEIAATSLDIVSDSGGGILAGTVLAKRQQRQSMVSSGVEVNASVYTPGGGGIEGPTKDNRGRRLLPTDKAVATPAAFLPNGIPYGSTVRVTNPKNGLSTEAIARDSGPFAPGRQLDITNAVAKAIGFEGLGKLRIELVRVPAGSDPNGVYQIGEAKRFGPDRASNIMPGMAISMGSTSASSTSGRSTAAQRAVEAFVSPFPGMSRSEFANQQLNPVEKLGATRMRRGKKRKIGHQGEDFAAPAGTPVQASFTGKATIEDWSNMGYPAGYAVVTTFTDSAGREVKNRRGHLNPQSVRKALGRGPTSVPFDIQAGQQIGTVQDLGSAFFRRNPGTRNHLHDEVYVNGKVTSSRQYLLGGRGNGGTSSSETPQQRAVNAIKAEQDNITSKATTRIGAIDREIAEGRDKVAAETEKAKLLREQSIALDKLIPRLQALRKQYPDAETGRDIDSVTQSINSQGAAAANAAKQLKDDARSRAIANVRTALSDATTKTENRNAGIGKAEAAGVISAAQAERDRNSALQEQYTTINKLLPQIGALRKQYPDDDTRRELDAITQSINSQATAALNSAKTQAQQPIRLLNTRVDEAKARAERDIANIDNAAKQDGSREAELNALDLKAARLRNLSGELQSAREEAGKLALELQDPESQRQLSEIADKLRDIRTAAIEASRAAPEARATRMVDEPLSRFSQSQAGLTNYVNNGGNANQAAIDELEMRTAINEELQVAQTSIQAIRDLTTDKAIQTALDAQLDRIRAFSSETTKLKREAAENATQKIVTGFKSYGDQLNTDSNREIQTVKNQRLEGLITEREELEKITEVRARLSEQLAQTIPQLQLMRREQSDPAIIEQINEQIAAYQQQRSEIIGAQREQSVMVQTGKTLTTSLQEGFKSFFVSAFQGFKDLGSVVDGLLNKIADAGINALFSMATGKGSFLGGILGFKDGGEIPNFFKGGKVQNFATGGQVLGAIEAVDKALTKEGPTAVLAALTPGEQVLERSKDAPLYRAMVSDGTWQRMRQSYNYSSGGTVAGRTTAASSSSRSVGTASSSSRPASVTVTRINRVDYVTVAELQGILEVQIPLAARAGAAITERNMADVSWRQRNGL
jgi:TP901 family phage tail tape measure protein